MKYNSVTFKVIEFLGFIFFCYCKSFHDCRENWIYELHPSRCVAAAIFACSSCVSVLVIYYDFCGRHVWLPLLNLHVCVGFHVQYLWHVIPFVVVWILLWVMPFHILVYMQLDCHLWFPFLIQFIARNVRTMSLITCPPCSQIKVRTHCILWSTDYRR